MRTKKALTNMLWSLFSYALLLFFGIVLRRLLLQNFDTEVIGYEGVIADMFSFIALADFGLDSLFNYRLYEAFAGNDNNRINKLSNMYKKLWNTLGFIVFAICTVLYFFLPNIFEGKINNWGIFRINFVLYAISVLSTYFLGYWRTILTASQKEYKAVKVETTINFVAFFLKLVSLLLFKDFILYLIINVLCILLSKFLIYIVTKKEFSFFHKVDVDASEFIDEGMISECPQLIMIKTADVVNWSSTNLFTSLLINIKTSALFMNYSIIGSAVWSAIASFLRPIRSTLADMIYKEDKEETFEFFKIMDLACFFIATIILVCYSVVFQPAIKMFFGEEYLLSSTFVYVYAVLYYFAAKTEATNSFRECLGDYKEESIYSFFAVITVIVLSYLLSKKLGLSGIILSTIISYLIVLHSRKNVLIKKFYNHSLLESWSSELMYFLLALIELSIAVLFTNKLSLDFFDMIIRGIIGVLVPTIINVIVFRKSRLLDMVINTVKNRFGI